MTPISQGRILRRETKVSSRGKFLVVELKPYTLRIRPKGARWSYEIPWDSIFMLGARQQAERDRQERKKRPRV